MKVAISTRGERPIPWPATEQPPAKGDQIAWDGEVWSVCQVRWTVNGELRCDVLVEPVTAMYDADARSR